MSDASRIRHDGSLLSRADQLFFKLESALNLLGGLVIFALVLLAVANILGRKLFNFPVSGYIDWTEQSMAFFAFLGISFCQRTGGHIRMDIFVSRLKGRTLWFFEFVSTLFMFIMTIILIYGSFLHFNRAWVNGDSSFDIELPTWPSKLIVPIALSVLSLRLFLQLWAYLRAIREGSSRPVAVPLIEDAAALAAHEAEVFTDSGKDK